MIFHLHDSVKSDRGILTLYIMCVTYKLFIHW